MALRARGEAPDQQSLHADKSVCGRPFEDLLDLVPGATCVTDLDLLPRIRMELAAEHSLVVEVIGRRWMYLDPVVRARNETRTPWLDDGEFLHVVVLYALEETRGVFMPEDEFLCLDPFFPPVAQPLRLTADQLRGVCCRAIIP